MSEETAAIREDITMVRDSMTEKIEQIEMKVRDTVDTTVEQVNRFFDVEQQVQDRPWAPLGVAAVAGYLLGSVGGSSPPKHSRQYQSFTPAHAEHPDHDEETESSAIMNELSEKFGSELRLITEAALAAGVTLLRDTVKQSVPQFEQEYEKLHSNGNSPYHRDIPQDDRATVLREERQTERHSTIDPHNPINRPALDR